MATRKRIVLENARRFGVLWSSDRWHRSIASSSSSSSSSSCSGDDPPIAAGTAGNKREKLWQEFFSDPSQWWDNRFEKGTAKYPDFKHKTTQAVLWLDNQQNPAWVGAELAKMAPGTVQLHSSSWTRRLTRYVKAGQYEKMMELFQQM
jgi:pentatricopeptide repeat protein